MKSTIFHLVFVTRILFAQISQPFQINDYLHDNQQYPSCIELNNGNLFVCWESYGEYGTQNGNDIIATIINNASEKIVSPFLISDSTQYSNLEPWCTKLSNGNVLITWTEAFTQGAISGKIMAKIINHLGENINNEIFKMKIFMMGLIVPFVWDYQMESMQLLIVTQA